jgi:MFS superfamily sulfate permease-like transporter
VMHMGDVRYVDQSGVYCLGELAQDLQTRGIRVYIAALWREPRELLAKLEIAPGMIPVENIFESASDAIQAAINHTAEPDQRKQSA